jgi:alginate O-acetyltransferase complex protein AlgI
MLFSTPIFLFCFLPLVLALFFATKRCKAVLLASSLIFYAWGEPTIVFLLLFVIVFNYVAGNVIFHAKFLARSVYFSAALAIDILILLFFKYQDFIAQNINAVLSSVHIGRLPQLHIPLPLGISFFTFQSLAYLIDIYLCHIEPACSLYRYALFKSFFPQLIAGPIARYQQVSRDFSEDRSSVILFAEGVSRFAIGLSKKTILADNLAPVVDAIFQIPANELSMSMAWIGAIAFSLQIYFDFSGYSDMAIGLGLMFGIRLPENFNYPYAATSIRNFWRRWHITLSTWFRDYLYIPLGGSRDGTGRTFVNLFTVFALCGLWHGAAWHFVWWGMYHGMFIILERTAIGRIVGTLPKVLQRSYALLVIVVGWVIFRSVDLHYGVTMILAMAGANGWTSHMWPAALYLNAFIWSIIVLGIFFSMPIGGFLSSGKIVTTWVSALAYELGIAALLIASIAAVASQTHHAFIYFRF